MKTTFQYDHYLKYDELKVNMELLSNTFPDLMKLEINCVTPEGRNQYAAIVTNQKTGDALSKPALYIDGNIHAGEITATEAAMYTLDYLLTNYGSDEEVTDLLDTKTFYIIPRVSPDGSEKYLTTPYTLRSAPREYCAEAGGMQREDLDGDGVVRMMAIPTPYGAWKKDPENTSQMQLRKPCDTKGDFYDIYPEGILEAYEGDENLKSKKDTWGLDFNRNFPLGWFPEARQSGAGKYPLSNPETKALVDFALAHPNIGGAAIGHTSGGLILYPPGTMASKSASNADINVMKTIAEMGEAELNYKPMNIFDSFMKDQTHWDSGALDDWFYQSQGVPAYTMEFWDVSTKAGVPYDWGQNEPDKNKEIERFNAIMKWVKENAPEYYMDWTEFDHPTFGKVLLGGFNIKFTLQNPPEKLLLHECEQDAKFNIEFAQALPHLIIDSISSKKIEESLYEITAVVGNLGYMSTVLTEEAVSLKTAEDVEVKLTAPKIFSGKQTEKIKVLEGYSSTMTGSYYGNLTTMKNGTAKKKLTWIIQANEGDTITINASQIKSGSAQASIKI